MKTNQTTNKRPAPHLDRDLSDREGEEWRDVVGHDGCYEISNHGRVKSLPRLTMQGHMLKCRIRKQSDHGNGLSILLSVDGKRSVLTIMGMVADAFLLPKPATHTWYHKSDNASDNRPCNIGHGTRSTAVHSYYGVGLRTNTFRDGRTIGDVSIEKKQKHLQIFGRFDGGVLVAQVCTGCVVEKPASEFVEYREGNNRICRDCQLMRKGVKQVGKARLAKEMMQAGLRRCNVCGQTKALEADFYRNKRQTTGYDYSCKPCRLATKVANCARKATA